VSGRPPAEPYPPDLDDDARPVARLEALVDVVAENADWANASARGLVTSRAALRRCRFTGAELAEAHITDTTFDECRLDLAGMRMARLERVAFRDCRMSECDLYDATLMDVLFERCELGEATFTGARLERVEMVGCDLTGLEGPEALRGVRMRWDDVVRNASLLAAALAIEIVE